MRIGVISDTHIPDRSEHIPEVVLNAFKHVDLVVHAGDIVNLEVINELKLVCPKIIAVAGNMDSQAIVKNFPVKDVFEISGLKFGIMHGYGSPMNLIDVLKDSFKKEKPDVIIFGHSHEAMNKYLDGVLFFNPGSATDCLSAEASYGLIEIEDSQQGHKINAKIIKI
ncbi:MAG: metallophosphoesterase [Candidatus Omnitrophica bacterium]|nr:metallophosphoesterase [Candidatus Omnitrophota bacterium]